MKIIHCVFSVLLYALLKEHSLPELIINAHIPCGKTSSTQLNPAALPPWCTQLHRSSQLHRILNECFQHSCAKLLKFFVFSYLLTNSFLSPDGLWDLIRALIVQEAWRKPWRIELSCWSQLKRSSLNQWKSSLQWPTYTVLSRVTVPDNPCILVEESTTQSYSSTSSVFSSYSDTLELWDFIRLSNLNGITRKSTAEMP